MPWHQSLSLKHWESIQSKASHPFPLLYFSWFSHMKAQEQYQIQVFQCLPTCKLFLHVFAFITCMSWDIWVRLCILRVLSMSSTFAYCHSASPLVGQNIVQKCTTHKGTGALTPRPMSPYCRSESTLQNYKGSSCKRQPAVRYAYMTGARETHTGQLWTQRQCSSIHSEVRMSLLMMNLPMRWMMRNCTSLTKKGFIRFVLCFFWHLHVTFDARRQSLRLFGQGQMELMGGVCD